MKVQIHLQHNLLKTLQLFIWNIKWFNIKKILTSQPVIPAAFQDGKFVNVGGSSMSGSLTSKYHDKR